MTQDLVSVEIRPHLIPYFFNEMEGTPASYDGEKVKMIRLLPSSSLANYIYTQIGFVKHQKRSEPYDNFMLFLSIKTNNFYVCSGKIYLDKRGVKSELKMTIDKARDLNNILEDIFRTNMVSYVDGFIEARGTVVGAVDCFMKKYNLIEYGFENETMRKMYYEQKKKKILSRFQIRSSNKVLNWA